MGKKKLFKEDGITEDFDAEALEVDDEAAAPGLITGSDAHVDESAPEIKDEAAVAPAANVGDDEGLAAKTTDEKAELPLTPHTPAEKEPSQSDTVNAEPAPEAKAADVADEGKPAESESAPATATASEPEAFTDLHGEVSELGGVLGDDALAEIKKAGNALTPAVSKLRGMEEKLEQLGDEAKARFEHARTMMVNAMGALERLFKRGK